MCSAAFAFGFDLASSLASSPFVSSALCSFPLAGPFSAAAVLRLGGGGSSGDSGLGAFAFEFDCGAGEGLLQQATTYLLSKSPNLPNV